MKTETHVKKSHRRTCKNKDCKIKFTTTDSRKVYCSRECKDVGTYSPKRKVYEIPRTNHFFIYLTKEVQRAGTLHILDKLVANVEALQALYAVVKVRLVANVLSGKELFHVAHIAPSKHEYTLGLLCAENLLIAPAVLNKRHTNTHANKAGVFMYRADMEIKNTILSDDQDILDRVIDYIGHDTVVTFCKKSKLTTSQRQAAIKKLSGLVDTANPDHAQFISLLSDSTAKTPQIVAAIEAINGFKEFKPMMKGQRLSESAMLIMELIRHAEFRGELEDCAAIARQYTRADFTHIGLSLDAQRTLFKLMHGYLEPEMENETDCLMYELRAPVRAARERQKAVMVDRQAMLERRTVKLEAEASEKACHIAYMRTPGAQYFRAEFEADHFDLTDYCPIPYMMKLNLTKTRHAPESGTILSNGDVAF
ncbi:hypothetical protein [Pseudomonas putida]|uniref:hypothetical protein n=1 Tax=Pseudomonas putida TaxID=303 RepID=UPI000645709C|nr:hypothetical protein [Pseudomonas putida]